MKNLFLIKKKVNEDTGEMEEYDKEQLYIEVNDEKIAVQVKDFMNTETYFAVSLLVNENKQKQMKDQGYFLMNQMIVNPKISDALINLLPWMDTFKITKALTDEFLPEDSFLELGVPLEELSQK